MYTCLTFKNIVPFYFCRYLGLIIYMGIVQVPSINRYWRTDGLYHGLWARHFLTRDRYKAISSMLHMTDPSIQTDPEDKLRKLRPLLDHIKRRCSELYTATVNVAVDERMVKSKGRSGIRQFIPNKPTRFGIKLWILAESSSGYTLNFDVYTGKRARNGDNGLAYDVVVSLCSMLENEGYHVYFDNFFTSTALLNRLLDMGLWACGTCVYTRRGFPAIMKDKAWGKRADRGDMRYIRQGPLLYLQWKDNKVIILKYHEYSIVFGTII